MKNYWNNNAFIHLSISVFTVFLGSSSILHAQSKLTDEEANLFYKKNSAYFERNCRGSTSFECAQSYASIVYIDLYFKKYNKALDDLNKFPSYLPDQFTNCDHMSWSTHPNSKGGKFFSIDRWAVISVLNKKLDRKEKFQPKQYTHAYLCKALNEALSFGPAPNDEFPVTSAEFAAMAPKYLPKKEAATLARFEQEIAIPFRAARDDINGTHIPSNKPSPKDKRIQAASLRIELMKNAISEASGRGFPNYYVDWIKDAQKKERHYLKLEEKTR